MLRAALMAFLHFGTLALALYFLYSDGHHPILMARWILGLFCFQIALWAFFSRSIPDKMRRGNKIALASCVLWVLIWGANPEALMRSLGFTFLPNEMVEAKIISTRKTQVRLKLGARTRWFSEVQFQTSDKTIVETEVEFDNEPNQGGARSDLSLIHLSAFPKFAYAQLDPVWVKDFSSRFLFPMIFSAFIGFLLAIRPSWSNQT